MSANARGGRDGVRGLPGARPGGGGGPRGGGVVSRPGPGANPPGGGGPGGGGGNGGGGNGGGDGGHNGGGHWGQGHGGWYGYPYYGFGYGFYDPFWPYPYYYPYSGFGLSYSYYPRTYYDYAPAEPALPPEDYLDAPVDGGNLQEQIWYYCEDPAGYYPYVRSCNGAWQAVPATPPSATPEGDAPDNTAQAPAPGN